MFLGRRPFQHPVGLGGSWGVLCGLLVVRPFSVDLDDTGGSPSRVGRKSIMTACEQREDGRRRKSDGKGWPMNNFPVSSVATGLLECWNDGMLECWNVGMME